MKRGQIFTMDLFAAYGLFIILMTIMLLFAGWMADAYNDQKAWDGLTHKVNYAQEHIVNAKANPPYNLTSEFGSFIAQPTDDIKAELDLRAYNVSVKILDMDGNIVVEGGEYNYNPDYAVSLKRYVTYNNENAKLVVTAWVE